MNPSSSQLYKGSRLLPTPVSEHQYTGVTLDLKKHGSLSSQGAFFPPTTHTRNTYNRGDIQAAESLTTLRNAPGSSTLGHHPKNTTFNKMGPNISTYGGTNNSPFSSESEIHPSSGVPLNQSDGNMPTTTQPQHANFSQLAEHQGIHDWNNSVFDDRWLLQPEEIWKLEARHDSVITVSPERLAQNRNTSRAGDQEGMRTEGSQCASTQNAHMQRVVRETENEKEHRGRHVSIVPTEARHSENRETLTASGKLAIGQKGNHTNQ